MSFKKFGGLNYSAKSNIISNHYSNSGNLGITDTLGQPNSKIVSQSHIDMSANSIMNIGSLYFMDGTMQTTAPETDPTGKAIFNNGIIVNKGNSTTAAIINGDLHVTGTSQLDGAVTMGSTLEVTGTSQLDGAVTMGSTLEVTGATTLDGPGNVLPSDTNGSYAALNVSHGGAFINNDLMVYGGGNIANIYGPSAGTLKIGGGTSGPVGVSEILLGNTYTLPPVKILTTAESTSTTDGALIVSGGVGIAKSCYALTFNSSSDYRIKEDVTELNDEFNIDKLRPVTYTNKNTKKQDIGFIAHEIQEEFPYLVSGEKDGEQMQSINYIGLIGVLVKEIQELKKRVHILENK
jgi:Chaperone of endosialidase